MGGSSPQRRTLCGRAAYLRLALMHLGTDRVGMGTSGAMGPVVLGANRKYAVLMPLSKSGSGHPIEMQA